uniref:NTR domain-containing protein n=1 Tax=Anolis carolinensis TaxID=28377 RepID=A0A803TPG7_ANOCA
MVLNRIHLLIGLGLCLTSFLHNLFILCSYSMVVPSVLWVESEELIVVEAHGLSVATEVAISVQDFPQRKNIFYQIRATMNPVNGMMVTPFIKVPGKDLKKDFKNKQYVVVQAYSPQFTLEKVVLVSFQSGYIFTQTDKPIYTPGSSGYAEKEMQDHISTEIQRHVMIMSVCSSYYSLHNCYGITYISFHEHLPLILPVFSPVLPSFEVAIEPEERFYYADTEKNFSVVITARYLYGKKVEGVAFVLFGVKIDDGKKSIPDSLRRIPIQEGEGHAVLTRDMLQTQFRNLNMLAGHLLYVSVTVMTELGSDMVMTERSDINIVTSPYQILFTKTSKFFKPGMPYELMVFVTNPDGSPAAHVAVVSEPIRVEATTQDDGTARLMLNIPADTQELRITVTRLTNERQATKTMIVTAYETQEGSGNYLHLLILATELKVGDHLPVMFQIKSSNLNVVNQIRYFTYMILSKGRIIKVGRQPRSAGQNPVTMSLSITPNLIPSFRIVAYYQVGNREIVADSVWVDVKDTCMGTLVVKGATETDNHIHWPGNNMEIIVEGDANAQVGLVAVDKAVYALYKKSKISQTKIWDTVENSDIGCTAGSGRNNVGVFEDAGLALETSNKLSTKQRSGRIYFSVKDSITTWEVLAVSISETKGICVAAPYEITVMKDFFIDLRMPYSVVRNEQIEIQAILYNYGRNNIKVRVELIHNPAFCSASTAKRQYRHDVTIRAQSSTAVPFILVTLKLGFHDVEVQAAVWNVMVADGVKKKLRVVVGIELGPPIESAEREIVARIVLQPKGEGLARAEIGSLNLDDIVPGTEIETKISIQGNPTVYIAEESIDGSNLRHLIITPSGDGESNMITMTPTVIATQYLDATNQWEKVGVNRRSEAIRQIMKGYAQELAYMKPDFSYAARGNHPSSTWLTAYVVKIFALASHMVSTISYQVICGGVKWLILEKQKIDGIFTEEAPVIFREMVVCILSSSSFLQSTCFYAQKKIKQKLTTSINRAADYLLKKYNTLQRPYTTALTAYALALAGRLNDDRILMAASTGGNYWEDHDAHAYNIESTSYALLALLKMKKFESTGNIVKWLREQKYYGGIQGQTQATIMMFQALAQYEIGIHSPKDFVLAIAIELPEFGDLIRYKIEHEDAFLARTARTRLNADFTVQASGQGNATMTVVTLYNAQMKADATQCKNFTLDVSVEPLELIQRNIARYEINRGYSERGNLIIYLDKISHSNDECLQFRAHQFFEVGLIQPASVKVYSYYNTDEQCIKFYHLPKESSLLSKICYGDVCRCAEGKMSWKDSTSARLIFKVCIYGNCIYKTKLVQIEEENGFDNYFMQVLERIKEGIDQNPEASPRKFISQMKCRETLNLQENNDYLIWGITSDLWPANNDFYYFITKDTWIERWPSEDECEDERFQNLCNDFDRLIYSLTLLGCQGSPN